MQSPNSSKINSAISNYLWGPGAGRSLGVKQKRFWSIGHFATCATIYFSQKFSINYLRTWRKSFESLRGNANRMNMLKENSQHMRKLPKADFVLIYHSHSSHKSFKISSNSDVRFPKAKIREKIVCCDFWKVFAV